MANHLESDDYFEVLGLPRSASAADVKKAYRKLAIQWHPDKNRENPKAEEYFKRIAEAYEVLSNPDKRRTYEQFGKPGLNGGGAGGGEDFGADPFGFGAGGFSARHAQDIFEAFFGGADPFADFFGGRTRQQGGSGRRERRRDPFGEDFGLGGGFGGGFGMMDSMFDGFGDMGSMNVNMSSMSMGGGGGFSQSVSSSTFTDANGHVVTQKTTTTTQPDGQTQTVTEEYRNGKLLRSTTNASNRLADAGRRTMQLEGSGRASQPRVAATSTHSSHHRRY